MSESKSALIIANFRYEDPELRQLVAPAEDAEALARVLGDPTLGGFAVRTLINEPSYKVYQEIEEFCDNRKHDDVLLIYFSGHGVKDVEAQLYFATIDTQLVKQNVRRSTAVSARDVNEIMTHSQSRRQILLVDCCYSGAFKDGMMAKAGKQAGAAEQLEGKGRIVLTACDALQYSFEGGRIEGEGVRSIFTRTLVRGLETGEADLDRDGLFSLDEVYDYVFDRVSDEQPGQKPTKMGYVEGRLFIGTNPRPLAAALPPKLLDSLEDDLPWVRRGAVQELEILLGSNNRGIVLAAEKALADRAAKDDSEKIRALAAGILASRPPASVPVSTSAQQPPSVGVVPAEAVVTLQNPPASHGIAPQTETPIAKAVDVGPLAKLPEQLQERLRDERVDVRIEAVMDLDRLAAKNPEFEFPVGRALAEHATGDSSEQVRRLAGFLLASRAPKPVQADQQSPSNGSHVSGLDAPPSPPASIGGPEVGARHTTLIAGLPTHIVRLLQGRIILTLRHRARVHRVAWNSSGRVLATGADAVRLWDAGNGEQTSTFGAGSSEYDSVAWGSAPMTDLLAAANTNLELMIWKAANGELQKSLRGPGSPLAWRPTGPWLACEASYSSDPHATRILVQDFVTGNRLPVHCSNTVVSLAWSPNGEFLAVGSMAEKFARIWHAETGQLKHTLECEEAVFGLSWHPDGSRLATATASTHGTASVWDAVTGTRLVSIPVAERSVQSEAWDVSWSPNGRWLATGSEDGTARVWDATSGKELLKLKHHGPVHSVAWSPDGSQLATGSYDQTAKIWAIEE